MPRVRDAYPETFRTYASRRALIVSVNVTRQLGAVTWAPSWRAALLGTPEPAHGEYELPVPGWIAELLARPDNPDVRRPGLFLAPDYDFRCRSKNSTIRRRASMADASWNCDPVNRPSTAKSTGMSAES